MSPATLYKKEEKSMLDKIDDFALKYANIIVPVCLVLLIVLFIGLCYAVCGISAVESGTMRNFMVRGV